LQPVGGTNRGPARHFSYMRLELPRLSADYRAWSLYGAPWLMVKEGSTVRVRQRALQKAREKRRFLVQVDLLRVERALCDGDDDL
jgi:hypothetical protein